MRRDTCSTITFNSTKEILDDPTAFRCLCGRLSIANGIRLVLLVGVVAILTILSLEIVYFRRAIFILMIPSSVTLMGIFAIARRKHSFVWPIIGISCFHVFVSLYFGIIFLFYYFFKPLYIIMVLNWAFDTLYTDKTPSYYIQCAVIFTSIVTFGLFNLWQLSIAYSFKEYLQLIDFTSSSQHSLSASSVSVDERPQINPTNNNNIYKGSSLVLMVNNNEPNSKVALE